MISYLYYPKHLCTSRKTTVVKEYGCDEIILNKLGKIFKIARFGSVMSQVQISAPQLVGLTAFSPVPREKASGRCVVRCRQQFSGLKPVPAKWHRLVPPTSPLRRYCATVPRKNHTGHTSIN